MKILAAFVLLIFSFLKEGKGQDVFNEFDFLPEWWPSEKEWSDAGVSELVITYYYERFDDPGIIKASRKEEFTLNESGKISSHLQYQPYDTLNEGWLDIYIYDQHQNLLEKHSGVTKDSIETIKRYKNIYDERNNLVECSWKQGDETYTEILKMEYDSNNHIVASEFDENHWYISMHWFEYCQKPDTLIERTIHPDQPIYRIPGTYVDKVFVTNTVCDSLGRVVHQWHEYGGQFADCSVGMDLSDEYLYDSHGRVIENLHKDVGQTILKRWEFDDTENSFLETGGRIFSKPQNGMDSQVLYAVKYTLNEKGLISMIGPTSDAYHYAFTVIQYKFR